VGQSIGELTFACLVHQARVSWHSARKRRSAQASLLHQVFHLAELLRPRAQLVVNQHRQAPPVAFESARQRLFVAAFGLFQQREGGCGRFHTCAVCALGT
jgi:hypothetical protein